MDEDALARFRRDAMGVVFQNFHLIPTMTALENVATPLELAGTAMRSNAPRRNWRRSVCRIGAITTRRNCRAANNSVWRWPAPRPRAQDSAGG